MKKILIINVLCFLALTIFAQQPAAKVDFKSPTPSPEAAFTQQFGGSEIGVAYARPSARGRKVFGTLVPFDSIWRTGASECTTLKFKEEVIIGGKKMAAGKYALFTIPSADEWTIILNSDTTLHGAFGYDAAKDLHRFKVKSVKIDRFYETFTIEINDFTPTGEASLNLIWENTLVRIPLKSGLDDNIMAQIQKNLIEGKEQNGEFMYQAASYYYATKRDLKQAGQWATAAANLDPENFYIPNLAQKIFADAKEYKAAIEMVKRAIPLAEKKKMTSTVASLNKRIAEWQTMLGEKPTTIAVETPVVKTETTPKVDAHVRHDMSKMDKNTEGSPKTQTAPKMDSPASMDMSQTVDLKAQFAPVLSAYYGLKDALVADNAKLAAEKGKAMKTALRGVETKNWTAKQRTAYDAVAKKMDTDAEHIGDNAGKIDHQREHFITLSNNLTTLVKTLKVNSETTYSQFCPMANDGKGAFWLSKENKVKNPYYGKSMLTCGSVKETLK
jgi:tetratricopeptide (TPR) repeat protein